MNLNYFRLAEDEIIKICTNQENCEEIFCKLHDDEHLGLKTKQGHVCIACNLNESISKIHKFLSSVKTEDDIEYSFTLFILLTYLTAEKLTIIFKHIGITYEYVEKKWQILVEIRKWANFIKHPKGFLFSHHPEYVFENEKIESKYKNWKIINYKDFVEPLYKREDEVKYKQTINQIGNKKNILVVIPNPVRVIKELTIICNEFCEKIKHNEHFKEILREESFLEDY